MKTRNCFLRVLSFFILFSSLICGGPQYVECQDPYPDEVLDLFGMPETSRGSLITLKYHPPLCCFSNLFPKTHSARCHESGNLYSGPFPSELFLLVSQRC